MPLVLVHNELPGFFSYGGTQNCSVRDVYLLSGLDVTLLIMPKS